MPFSHTANAECAAAATGELSYACVPLDRIIKLSTSSLISIVSQPPQRVQKAELSEYEESEDWRKITEQLDKLDSSDFMYSKLPMVKYKEVHIRSRKVAGKPSLLLYGLTEDKRYNGSAEILGKLVGSDWLLVQAVSGTGKTRAILDVFANGLAVNDQFVHLYFDLCT